MLPGVDGPASFSLAAGGVLSPLQGGVVPALHLLSNHLLPPLCLRRSLIPKQYPQRLTLRNGQFVVQVAVQVRSSTSNAHFRRLTTLPQVL